MPCNLLDRAIDAPEFISDLHHRVPDQPRIEPQRPLDFILGVDGRVELHDKVMALSVRGLVFGCWSWQVKLSPVL